MRTLVPAVPPFTTFSAFSLSNKHFYVIPLHSTIVVRSVIDDADSHDDDDDNDDEEVFVSAPLASDSPVIGCEVYNQSASYIDIFTIDTRGAINTYRFTLGEGEEGRTLQHLRCKSDVIDVNDEGIPVQDLAVLPSVDDGIMVDCVELGGVHAFVISSVVWISHLTIVIIDSKQDIITRLRVNTLALSTINASKGSNGGNSRQKANSITINGQCILREECAKMSGGEGWVVPICVSSTPKAQPIFPQPNQIFSPPASSQVGRVDCVSLELKNSGRGGGGGTWTARVTAGPWSVARIGGGGVRLLPSVPGSGAEKGEFYCLLCWGGGVACYGRGGLVAKTELEDCAPHENKRPRLRAAERVRGGILLSAGDEGKLFFCTLDFAKKSFQVAKIVTPRERMGCSLFEVSRGAVVIDSGRGSERLDVMDCRGREVWGLSISGRRSFGGGGAGGDPELRLTSKIELADLVPESDCYRFPPLPVRGVVRTASTVAAITGHAPKSVLLTRLIRDIRTPSSLLNVVMSGPSGFDEGGDKSFFQSPLSTAIDERTRIIAFSGRDKTLFMRHQYDSENNLSVEPIDDPKAYGLDGEERTILLGRSAAQFLLQVTPRKVRTVKVGRAGVEGVEGDEVAVDGVIDHAAVDGNVLVVAAGGLRLDRFVIGEGGKLIKEGGREFSREKPISALCISGKKIACAFWSPEPRFAVTEGDEEPIFYDNLGLGNVDLKDISFLGEKIVLGLGDGRVSIQDGANANAKANANGSSTTLVSFSTHVIGNTAPNLTPIDIGATEQRDNLELAKVLPDSLALLASCDAPNSKYPCGAIISSSGGIVTLSCEGVEEREESDSCTQLCVLSSASEAAAYISVCWLSRGGSSICFGELKPRTSHIQSEIIKVGRDDLTAKLLCSVGIESDTLCVAFEDRRGLNYFGLLDGASGEELWMSDHLAAGRVIIGLESAPVAPGGGRLACVALATVDVGNFEKESITTTVCLMEHVLPTQGSSSHRLRGVGTCEVPGACYAFAHYGDYLFAGSDERVSVIGWGLRNVEVLAECFTACRSAVTALCAIDGKGVLKRRKRRTAGEDDEAGDEIGDDKEVCIFIAAAELLHSASIYKFVVTGDSKRTLSIFTVDNSGSRIISGIKFCAGSDKTKLPELLLTTQKNVVRLKVVRNKKRGKDDEDEDENSDAKSSLPAVFRRSVWNGEFTMSIVENLTKGEEDGKNSTKKYEDGDVFCGLVSLSDESNAAFGCFGSVAIIDRLII